MLITRAEIEGLVRDVRVEQGRVTELAEHLGRVPNEELVEACGAALIPGLHDHHLHIRALAAASGSVHVGPPDVREPTEFAQRLRSACPRSGWIRAIGYHDSVAGPINAAALDAIVTPPVRVQHRSGALWILNSAAMAATGLGGLDHPGVERDASGAATGRFFRMDDWLRRVTPASELDFAAVGASEASRGVTALTDATPAETEADVADLVQAQASGALPQRLTLMAAHVPEAEGVQVGPLKIVLDEPRLPALADLEAVIVDAHAAGRPVAIHCLTRAELALALCALDTAGPLAGDRIEHAAVMGPEAIDLARRLGVTVVTQPNFVSERGDAYRTDVPAEELPDLYRLRSLTQAGIPLAAGTDAPFGSPDPWQAIAAASSRRTPDGAVLGAAERLRPIDALRLFHGSGRRPGRPRRVEVGTGDLVLLRAPLADALAHPSADTVALTIIGGRVVFDGR